MNNIILLFSMTLFLLNNKANLKFNIYDENNLPIKKANIILKPCNSSNYIKMISSSNGTVTLNGILKNKYQVTIYKDGYIKKNFILNTCKNINCNICLCHSNKNRLYGFITDRFDIAVNKAIVVLYKVINKNVYIPIRFTYTDFTGEYNFFNIQNGNYIVKSIK